MAEADRVISLVQTVVADRSLLERLTASKPEDRGAILADIGYDDLTPAIIAQHAHLLGVPPVEEIDDDQLASVAGGGAYDPPVTTTVPVCAVAAV